MDNRTTCRFCRREIKANAVICAWCGKNQKNGKVAGVSKFTKTGEIISSSVSKAKIVMKIIMGIVFLGLIGIGGFYGWEWYQANGAKITNTIVQQTDQLLANVTDSNQTKTAEQFTTTEPEQDTGPLKGKSINLPVNIVTQGGGKYHISLAKAIILDKQQSEANKTVLRIDWKIKVIPPPGVNAPLRVKIFLSYKPSGLAGLVYDRLAEVKSQSGKIAKVPEMIKRLEQSIAKLATAPARIKKKYSAQYQKRYEQYRRRHPEWFENKKEECSIFQYNKQTVIFRGDQTAIQAINFYFTIFLCKADGTVIKALNTEKYAVAPPVTNKLQKYNKLARSSGLKVPQGDIIYPDFNNQTRQLIFSFRKNLGFIITHFAIAGMKQIPTFMRKTKKINLKRHGKSITRYESKLSLNYPFGGLVNLQFKYLTDAGKVGRAKMIFYLPPPPPAPKVEYNNQQVKISWDNISQELPKKYFPVQPILRLTKNRKLLKTVQVTAENSLLDAAVSPGQPISYNITLEDGVCEVIRWSSDFGIEHYKQQLQRLINPYVPKCAATLEGVNITIPSAKNPPHPIRIALLQNQIYHENSGITAYKLLKTIIDGIAAQPEMVCYDRAARDYIIDEKYFAMSAKLRRQFQMAETDYAVQLRDYSRQDGNGVELWLFKRHIEGKNADKITRYWKIADIPITGNRVENSTRAVEKLIAKINQTLEFKTKPDQRQHNISPVNMICPPVRPLNQKFVINDYEALSETIFLGLNESNNTIKILSKSDWDRLFNERLRRFDKGHAAIDKMVREVLLTGRMWRAGSTKSYYFQAIDAFTGEVLGSKIFTGKIRAITAELSRWSADFKLSSEIKVDFNISKFHNTKIDKYVNIRPWQPKDNMLNCFEGLRSPPRKRHKYIAPLKPKMAKKIARAVNFYDLVKRQWQDGFRAKAIQMLNKDWHAAPTVKTGMLLCKYYEIQKNYQLILELYNSMLAMDDCPDSIANDYNKIKKLAKANTGVHSTKKIQRTASTPRRLIKTTTHDKKNGTTTISIGPPPGFWNNTTDKKSKPLTHKIVGTTTYKQYVPPTHISLKNEAKYRRFIDRDKIGIEWSPNAPCKTTLLAFEIPGKSIKNALNKSLINKYCVPLHAYLRCFPYSYALKKFFDYRNLYNYYYTPPKFNSYMPHWDDPDSFYYTPPNPRQIKAIRAKMKPSVIVVGQGWNSVNPFAPDLDENLLYTRLSYFFELNNLNDTVKVRAFFELKKHPDLPMPSFKFLNPRDNKIYSSKITTTADMIRYFAYEAIRTYHKNRKSQFTGQFYPLYQLLAVDYMAAHNDSAAKELYQKLMRLHIPTSYRDFRKTRSSINLLTFFIYKKKKTAAIMLRKLFVKADHSLSNDCSSAQLYLLAKCGQISLATKMARYANSDVLCWLPKPTLDKFLEHYQNLYLIDGTRNLKAARTVMLKSNLFYNKYLINRLLGKPPLEAYQQWRHDHLREKQQHDKDKNL